MTQDVGGGSGSQGSRHSPAAGSESPAKRLKAAPIAQTPQHNSGQLRCEHPSRAADTAKVVSIALVLSPHTMLSDCHASCHTHHAV